ncbi:MAG: hypothetical protein B6D46_02865 [Polyangiaceae bacterium UTPRO1]|nr:MAG: hypothetical protein B6D46_02865 [Polyangiaceae bacterium UTPRO1]
MIALASSSCSPSERATPAPTATTTPAAAVATAAAAAPPASPQASPEPGAAVDMNDFSDSADFDWGFEEAALGTDFEIDVGATAFYMPRGNVVTFKAKALNGTPPFTFTWDFGDGSPEGSGEMIKHRFDKTGNIEVVVHAKDAAGETAVMQLGLLVHHPVDYAYRMQADEKEIEALKAQYPDWVPVTPAPTP